MPCPDLVDCYSENSSDRRLPCDQCKAQSAAIVNYREHLQRSHVRCVSGKHSVFNSCSPQAPSIGLKHPAHYVHHEQSRP